MGEQGVGGGGRGDARGCSGTLGVVRPSVRHDVARTRYVGLRLEVEWLYALR